jgi:amino acid transporter
LGYRIKNRVLGAPLHTDALAGERLGIPTAVAVFSSDCISSSAYATEEILRVLVPVVGVFAFSLVVPITIAMLVVLAFLILSYRETIKEYPTAGGAYMVTRDNFNILAAQVAGVSLLTDYVLTVAVSTAAGTDALTSVVPALAPLHVLVALSFVLLIAMVNLRGVKESGKIFMVPTYVFIAAMVAMIGVGAARLAAGLHLHHVTIHAGAITTAAELHAGGAHGLSTALLYGAGLWVVLKAFASGGSAVTGVEAISNGVTAFREPQWRNARRALVIMGGTLAFCFLGLSFFATAVHPVPYSSGSPTVLSQVGKEIFGRGPVGGGLYLILQASTMLVLILAANTSFADFPRLANFAAADSFMPRQLMKRGHRLVLSNGILALAGTAGLLLVVTGARVSSLIPLYAVGVFTSFTMSQAGMTRHHLRKREAKWRRGVLINGTGCVLSLIVDLVILVTKFLEGAWLICLFVPLMVFFLTRLNRQYTAEEEELQQHAPEVARAPILRRHVVLVMVDQLNRAAARAILYARSLTPDEIRAVHIAVDAHRAEELAQRWGALGLARVPLELVDCPDRRVPHQALMAAAACAGDGQTEVTVLIPRFEYRRAWHHLLHDRTGAQIASAVGTLPHVSPTFVPYHFEAGRRATLTPADVLLGDHRGGAGEGAALLTPSKAARQARDAGDVGATTAGHATTGAVVVGGDARLGADEGGTGAEAPARTATVPTRTPGPAGRRDEAAAAMPYRSAADTTGDVISASRFRTHASITGRITAARVQPRSGVPTLELTLSDGTGTIEVVYLGRRSVPGMTVGRSLHVEGVVGEHHGRLAMLNPRYSFV